MAALLVVENGSRTKSTLRLFSSSRLALNQNLNVLNQFYLLGNPKSGLQ
jgi:hypothetical protein